MGIIEWFKSIGAIARAVIAISTISSAYFFGVTRVFSKGIRTLVDYKFVANEIFIFLICVAGIGVVFRLYIAIIYLLRARFILEKPTTKGEPDTSIYSPRLRAAELVARVLISIGFLCVGIFMAAGTFDPVTLLLWALINLSLMAAVTLFVAKYCWEEYSVPLAIGMGRLRQEVLLRPAQIFRQPIVISILVAWSLMMSFSLGVVRIRTLGMASIVCVDLKDRVVLGRVIGETMDGILVKVSGIEESPSFELRLPAKLDFVVDGSLNNIAYLSKESIISIEPTCPS